MSFASSDDRKAITPARLSGVTHFSGSAFGIAAHSVATQAGLGDAIDAWLAHDGPALLHVAIDAAAGVWPLVPPNRSNAEMLDGDADELAPLPLPEKHPSKTTAITEEIPDAIST